jgi:hypothetical protein
VEWKGFVNWRGLVEWWELEEQVLVFVLRGLLCHPLRYHHLLVTVRICPCSLMSYNCRLVRKSRWDAPLWVQSNACLKYKHQQHDK